MNDKNQQNPSEALEEEKLEEEKVQTEEENKDEEQEQAQEQEQKKDKDQKHVKNVSVKQCIGTIIFCLFSLVIFLIPFTFGNSGLSLTYNFLPIIGDGSILETPAYIVEGAGALFGLSDLEDIFQLVLDIDTLVFLAILGFDVLFSLILAIFRSVILRVFCKIITIIAGLLMIIIMFTSILQITGIFGALIMGVVEPQNFMAMLEISGVLFAIGMAIMSGMMIKRQFKWFGKLY